MLSLLDPLYKSYQFAHEFNTNIELRTKLWRSGFLNHTPQLPAMYQQEREALTAYIRLGSELYSSQSGKEEYKSLLPQLWE